MYLHRQNFRKGKDFGGRFLYRVMYSGQGPTNLPNLTENNPLFKLGCSGRYPLLCPPALQQQQQSCFSPPRLLFLALSPTLPLIL